MRLDLKIGCVLLDRAFSNVPVIQWLQAEELPFLMPVVFRGHPPKKRRPRTGLHAIKRQPAGCYSHTLKNSKQTATVSVYIAYRMHRNRKDGHRVQQKLLFAALRVTGTRTAIRERYRLRFGIPRRLPNEVALFGFDRTRLGACDSRDLWRANPASTGWFPCCYPSMRTNCQVFDSNW